MYICMYYQGKQVTIWKLCPEWAIKQLSLYHLDTWQIFLKWRSSSHFIQFWYVLEILPLIELICFSYILFNIISIWKLFSNPKNSKRISCTIWIKKIQISFKLDIMEVCYCIISWSLGLLQRSWVQFLH